MNFQAADLFCGAGGTSTGILQASASLGRGLGTPDFIVAAPGGVTLWIECKTKTGSLSKEQQQFGDKVRSLGHRWALVRSLSRWQMLAHRLNNDQAHA